MTIKEKIIAALTEVGATGLTSPELVKETGADYSTMKRVLHNLANAGKVGAYCGIIRNRLKVWVLSPYLSKEDTLVAKRMKEKNHRRQLGSAAAAIRWTTEKVAAYLAEEGYTLLSPYLNARAKITYICNKGHTNSQTWRDFVQGCRCKLCAGHCLTPEEAKCRRRFRSACQDMIKRLLRHTGFHKTDHIYALLGYRPEDLRNHLERHPNWAACQGIPWSVDHIFPVRAFLDYGITDFKVINRLDNLRPLPTEENKEKRDEYDAKDFEKWLIGQGIEPKYQTSCRLEVIGDEYIFVDTRIVVRKS